MRSTFLGYVFKRLIEAVSTLIGLVVLTFFLLKALPGGPFDDQAALHPLVIEKLSEEWGLHRGTAVQFFSYFRGILRGDLGWSMIHPDQKVLEIFAESWRNSFALNLCAVFVIFILSLCFSYIGYRLESKKSFVSWDLVLMAMMSLPGLFLGPFLIWLFAFKLEIFPSAFLTSPWHFVLPVLALSIRPSASLGRLLLGAYHSIQNDDYIRTARAKGLNENRIFFKHILKNSLSPALHYAGPLMVGILSGSFIVEVLFSIRGLGLVFVEAVSDRDYTVIMGVTLFYGIAIVIVSFGIDLLEKKIDPRTESSL